MAEEEEARADGISTLLRSNGSELIKVLVGADGGLVVKGPAVHDGLGDINRASMTWMLPLVFPLEDGVAYILLVGGTRLLGTVGIVVVGHIHDGTRRAAVVCVEENIILSLGLPGIVLSGDCPYTESY